ncbi:hypothetical protein LPJ64_001977 [Coemansia asiatica]|uniref:Yeast cell wall synthesis Kre9/Knh1-like N-terminal domain-containing protein n=1 Tax=Coemansia asiatica TaxID=1052880 RepID=A0A9W8CK36_9FUNG|nr:hypothetical protein LPJ64_001977 [Coemansia asiatica]
MKLTITALATLLSSVLATVYINNPVADTVWPHDGSPVTITWISSDDSLLTGTVIVQLMDGEDANNLLPILTIASGVSADKKSVTFTPPKDLPGSTNYAVRITSSVDGPHYSHTFTAGDSSITQPFSSSSSKTSSETDNSSSSTKKTSDSSDEEQTDKSSKEEDTESSEEDSESETHSSEEESSSKESESESKSKSESKHSSSETSGAGCSSVVVGGLVGAAAVVAALF